MLKPFVILDEAVLQGVADRMGDQSLEAKALVALKVAREDGEDAVAGTTGNGITICSRRFAEMRAGLTHKGTFI